MTTATSVPTAASSAPVAEPPARFRDLLTSEWIKMRSLRSTPWTLALTALFVIGSAAIAALAEINNLRTMSPAARANQGFHVFVAFPAAGYMALMLVAGSVGALTVVSEYSSGLIRTTTVAVPARGAVVLAKAVVTAALWTAVGTVISTGCFLISQAILNGQQAGVPLTHPGVLRALMASALLAPVCALIGLGFGTLIRHSATTMVTSAFTLVMLPPIFSQSARWSAAISHAMPVTAWKRLVQNWAPDPHSLAYSATVPGSWAVYALWPLIAVVLAVAIVRHRDV
ncbi:ABC transporter permease [Streptomyces mirabilis]|uniref:ABC transporter permease n=1 Tax=Streptomyces TaxID=1883 RepID=UPI001164C6F0|nr:MULTISPECIES: ABC transporter permease [Streptomyces]MCX4616816.1 ABC transporter permease [Streptomyces mirabilis]MCX5355045.1 ABC transporter permease [Streptomyces mirabilis]QDO13629.1 ABC transporter permease [Streptomyces sp. S1D4-23]